jgi:hypothetical protein
MTGRYPDFLYPEDKREKFFVTGGIMEYARGACAV